MKHLRTFWLLALLSGGLASALADYTVSLASTNAPVVVVAPGQSFGLDLILASDRDDRNNSVIVRIEFSAPGLVLEGYEWVNPYAAGDGNDDSRPRLGQLPTPLGPSTLSGTGYPEGAVDLELSNVTGKLPGFGSGRVAGLRLQVPEAYAVAGLIRVRAIPDEIAAGFERIPARVEQDFWVIIGPAPVAQRKLEIRQGAGVVVVLWPSAEAGFVLEQGRRLGVGALWQVVDRPVFQSADRNVVVLPSDVGTRFFRLRQR